MNTGIVAANPRAERPAWPLRSALTVGCIVVASAASVLVALLNQPYFAFVNGFVDARETVARGVLFSSWLVLVGGGIAIWRPSAFGFRIGETRQHWRLVLLTLLGAAAVTAILLRAVGSTPYSDASLLIETVVVPVTEELVFRAVLLTALLFLLGRLYEANTALVLAVLVDGLAFGLAHLANATSLATGFVLGQAAFAGVLGAGCAYLMARTRSVYPAILLHGVVNAVVVIAS